MKRTKFLVVCSIALFIFLAACNDSGNTSISLAEVTRSVFYAPQYVAIEKGFFEEEGLDVELQTTWGGDTTMTTLLSDGADIALVGSETSIYVYAQDSSDYAINFAQLTKTDGTFLVAKEEQPDFTWENLRDSNFLGQRVGGMPQMVGESVLKNHGIDPHADLDLSQNIDFGNIPGAFASGDYEYVQLFEPTASVFEAEGNGHIVASFGEESGNVPYTVFMAKQSYMDENDEEISKFTRAIYQAQQWVEDSSAEEIAEVIEPYFEDSDLDMLTASIDRYKSQDSFATDPTLDVEGWENLKNIMDDAGELPADVPYDELVNTEFAEEVVNN
ncbi:NitT/TauT family transport system substrate-binding protein [Virgibacillus natechei]|uniref:NitT/TauT family transport system substrate-binding protein n=1 Tax=Virgibacillus natechei TaxID=1216297 RepID=A0ABS4IFA7_9BACI|nr:ABC transporter substrate-binding protein [Virgibacillus natechei]MBP1969563.1 NitT/TauT family transport system substrate-binding protein [Virgibacillus natechei]UZD11739.1 ABC transporter substrate-binding protein [Virgibacillus natechei]